MFANDSKVKLYSTSVFYSLTPLCWIQFGEQLITEFNQKKYCTSSMVLSWLTVHCLWFLFLSVQVPKVSTALKEIHSTAIFALYVASLVLSFICMQSFSQTEEGQGHIIKAVAPYPSLLTTDIMWRQRPPRRLGASMSGAAFSFDTRASSQLKAIVQKVFPHLSQNCKNWKCCRKQIFYHFDKGPVDWGDQLTPKSAFQLKAIS